MTKTAPDYFTTTAVKGSLKTKAVRGGATTAIAQTMKFALTMGTTAVLARLLTPQDYGLVAMVTVITGFIAIFNYLGLSTATIQREEINHQQVSTLFWVNVAASACISILTALLGPVLVWFYGEPRLTTISIVLAFAFLLMGLGQQHQALLNRQMRFGAIAATEIIATAGSAVVGVGCALAGFGYKSLVAAHLTTAALTAAMLWWFCGWRPGRPGRIAEVMPMLRFGADITGFQVINYFARNGDSFLIGRFYGSRDLGLYNRAYTLFLLPLSQILLPITSVAVPSLSRVTGEQFRSIYLRMANVACILTMPFVAFTIGTADYIVTLFLGNQWSQAASIFVWMGIFGLVQPLAGTTGWVFVAQGRTREQFHSGLINGTLSVLAFAAGLPWGAVGVAAAYAISGLLIRTPIVFWFAGRAGAVKTRDFYVVAAPYLTASLAGLALCLVVRALVPLNVVAGIAIGGLATAAGSLGVLLAWPAGRRGIRDVVEVIQTIRQPQAQTVGDPTGDVNLSKIQSPSS